MLRTVANQVKLVWTAGLPLQGLVDRNERPVIERLQRQLFREAPMPFILML